MSIFQTCSISSVKNYCLSNGLSYRVSIPDQECLIYKPVSTDGQENGGIEVVTQPEVYIAELNDVGIVGGTTAIIANEEVCLLDKFPQWGPNRIRFDDGVIQDIGNNYIRFDTIESDNLMIEEGIMLCGSHSYNYFHWLFEFLTRFYLLENYPEYKDVPILVDEIIINTPQLLEALHIVNQTGHRIIVIKKAHRYQVKKLIRPSLLVWISPNFNKGVRMRYSDTLYSKQAIEFLRKRLINIPDDCVSNRYRRLYISRRNLWTRKLVNEDEIQQIFEEYGFLTIYPENMSFAEQQKIFGEAEIIAGSSGAAMSNMILAPLSTKVVCITSIPLSDTSLFSTLAGVAGQDIVFLRGRSLTDDPTNYHPAMHLSSEMVRSYLDTLMLRQNTN